MAELKTCEAKFVLAVSPAKGKHVLPETRKYVVLPCKFFEDIATDLEPSPGILVSDNENLRLMY